MDRRWTSLFFSLSFLFLDSEGFSGAEGLEKGEHSMREKFEDTSDEFDSLDVLWALAR